MTSFFFFFEENISSEGRKSKFEMSKNYQGSSVNINLDARV